MARISSIVQTKNVADLTCFSNFPGKQQHFFVSNATLVWCLRNDKVWTLYSKRHTINFGVRHIFCPNPLYILHQYTHHLESKVASRAGRRRREIPKKFMVVQVEINQPNDINRAPFYSPPLQPALTARSSKDA